MHACQLLSRPEEERVKGERLIYNKVPLFIFCCNNTKQAHPEYTKLGIMRGTPWRRGLNVVFY